MKSVSSIIESIIVGGGTLIYFIMMFHFVFEIDADTIEIVVDYLYWDEYGWIFLFPLLSLLVTLGIVMEHFSFALFWFWENNLRKSIQPIGKSPDAPLTNNFFYELRSYLFTSSNAQELAKVQNFLRSKIRIVRGSCINALLIFMLLIYREMSIDVFEPLIVPGIIISGLIFMGTLFSWYMLVIHELKWMEGFNETLLR